MTVKHIIEVEKKAPFGTAYFHPINEQAKKAVGLWGQKTFSTINIERLKGMGFVFVEVVRAGDRIIRVGEI